MLMKRMSGDTESKERNRFWKIQGSLFVSETVPACGILAGPKEVVTVTGRGDEGQ